MRATRHKCTEGRSIQFVIDGSANGREAFRHKGSLLVQRLFEKNQFMAKLLVCLHEKLTLKVLRTEKGDFH